METDAARRLAFSERPEFWSRAPKLKRLRRALPKMRLGECDFSQGCRFPRLFASVRVGLANTLVRFMSDFAQPVLDPLQLKRIQSTHRGFLYSSGVVEWRELGGRGLS